HDRTRFHECVHGCGADFTCPPYTYFEPSKNVCAYDANAGHQTPAPVTNNPPVTQPPVTQDPIETTPTHYTPAPWTPAPTHAPETTHPPHFEQTTVTPPHFVTSNPNEQTTRGRHGF